MARGSIMYELRLHEVIPGLQICGTMAADIPGLAGVLPIATPLPHLRMISRFDRPGVTVAAPIEASFRYRKSLQAGEHKPSFDGQEEGYASAGDEMYTTPKYEVLDARTMDEAPSE